MRKKNFLSLEKKIFKRIMFESIHRERSSIPMVTLPLLNSPYPVPFPSTAKNPNSAAAKRREQESSKVVPLEDTVLPRNTAVEKKNNFNGIVSNPYMSAELKVETLKGLNDRALIPAPKSVKEPTQHQLMLERLKGSHYEDFTREEHDYMMMQARNKAYAKLVYEYQRELVRRDMEDNSDKYFGENTVMSNHVKETAGAGSASKYVFWVINIQPDKQGDIYSILKAIEKTGDKTWINRWAANLEQRGAIGQDDFGTGIHVNILTEKKPSHMSKRISEMTKEIKNTWKHLAQVTIPGVLIGRPSPDPTNFYNYVNGIKADVEKDPLVEADRLWRKDYNNPPIPDVMGNWNDPQLQ